jgi:hypothetical protein
MKRAPDLLAFIAVLAFIALAEASGVEIFSKDSLSMQFSGYLQDQALHTRDFLGDPYDQNQVRFRPEFTVLLGSKLSAFYSHTAELTFGSCLDSLQYQVLKDIPPGTYYDWNWNIEDNEYRHVRSSIYRAYMVFEDDRVRFTAGRQRVAWGTALFWNPTDLFNPVDPVSLEPLEKEGVDGLSLELMLREFTYLDMVYGAGDKWDESRFAMRLKSTVKSFDISAMGGKFREDEVAGGAFSGYLFEGSLYGEGTYTWADERDDYVRVSFGYQYSWPNTFMLAAEYYHNSGNMEWEHDLSMNEMLEYISYYIEMPYDGLDISSLIPEDYFKDPLLTFGRNFLGIMTGGDLTPLVHGSFSMILDIDHESVFLGPQLSYLATGALTLEGGMQIFAGSAQGEYSWMHDMAWIRLRYIF